MPMPILLFLSTIKDVADDDPMANAGCPDGASMEREAKGEVVPMPTSPNGEAAVEIVKVGTMVVEVAILHASTVRFGIVEVERLLKTMFPELIEKRSPMASPM